MRLLTDSQDPSGTIVDCSISIVETLSPQNDACYSSKILMLSHGQILGHADIEMSC